MSMIDDAKRRNELERRARQAGLEPFAMQMAEAVGDDLIRDLVRDSRRQSPHKFDPLPAKPPAPTVVEPTRGAVYRPPAGTAIVDRMVDAFDALDRAQRERQFAAAGMRPPANAQSKPRGEA
jgi:hypothetical protein